MRPQLILLGAPGSGKGTQAHKLIDELAYKHLSTGDLLRSEIEKKTELGKKVADLIASGALVDDKTVLDLIRANSEMGSAHYIFDGFPRTLLQAQALSSEVLGDIEYKAIYFEVGLELLKDRLVNRRTCKGCGEIYNLLYKAPALKNTCDNCKGLELEQRKDDNEDSVEKRLAIFSEQIEPILDFYEGRGCLLRLDASLPPGKVFEKLNGLLK